LSALHRGHLIPGLHGAPEFASKKITQPIDNPSGGQGSQAPFGRASARRPGAASKRRKGKFFLAMCEAAHTPPPMRMIFRRSVNAVSQNGNLAMTAWKPAILRWSEEAEANHVREWAALDRGSSNNTGRPEACDPRADQSSRRRPLLSRVFTLFGRQN